MTGDTSQKRSRLEAEHERAEDGRRAHPISNAPYGTETHLNEEQVKRKSIDKEMKRGNDAGDHTSRPGDNSPRPHKGNQDAPNYDRRRDGGRALPADNLSSANDE